MSVAPPPAAALSYPVELSISCKSLRNADLLSKSDPMVVIYAPKVSNRPVTPAMQFPRDWNEVFRTEHQKDTLNPSFNKTFILDFRFEEIQPLKFVVVDVDNATASIADDDLLGTCETTLGEIAGQKSMKLIKPLVLQRSSSKQQGDIVLQLSQVATDAASRNSVVSLRCKASKLSKKDISLFGGSSDPYFLIKKVDAITGEATPLYRSETIMKNLNPTWNSAKIPYYKFFTVSQTMQQPQMAKLRVEVWDFDLVSADDLIGTAECTLDDIMQRRSLTLIDKGKTQGTFIFDQASIERTYTFLDYIQSGCEINLMCAVDFTGSNGDPTQPSSLHYLDPTGNRPNQYESVISSVGSILGYYDRDGWVPAWGFGGRIGGAGVSHCFSLNGNGSNPNVFGVNGIMQAYHQAIRSVQLYGPTYFNEVIRAASSVARSFASNKTEQKYVVLLIITDGEINDMPQTIDAIAEASELPMSIVIVGVGSADFTAMNVLDGDNGRLRTSSGKLVRRDLVQFVPFRNFANQSSYDLSKAVLAEIPGQLENYFRSNGIKPYGAQ